MEAMLHSSRRRLVRVPLPQLEEETLEDRRLRAGKEKKPAVEIHHRHHLPQSWQR